jgi:broad specificity phosphatase PhoE
VRGEIDVLLIRHGQTELNARNAFQGSIDASLSPLGHQQAARLRDALAISEADYVVASRQLRARQTAGHLLAAPETPTPEAPHGVRAFDAGFCEVDFGPWEDHTPEEIARFDPDGLAAYDADDLERFPGGETTEGAATRARAAIERHVADAEAAGATRLVVASHGTLIRLACTALLGLSPRRYRALFRRPDQCSWARFTSGGPSWRLDSYNRVAHD